MSLRQEEEKALLLMAMPEVRVHIGFDTEANLQKIKIIGTDAIAPETIRSLCEKSLAYWVHAEKQSAGDRTIVLSGGWDVVHYLRGTPVQAPGNIRILYYDYESSNLKKKPWCVFLETDTVWSSYPTAWGETPDEALRELNRILFPKGIADYDRPVTWKEVLLVKESMSEQAIKYLKERKNEDA
ncbi:MAG: hypothetical protein ACLQPD_24125 [Desulfomonilaceae bacterium]